MPGRQLGSRVVARCCEVGMVDGSSSVRAGGGPPEWETGGEGPATPVGVAAAGQRLPLLNQLSPTWDTRAPTLHCPPHHTNSTAKQTRPPGAPGPQHRSLGSAGLSWLFPGPGASLRREAVSLRRRHPGAGGKYQWTVWRGAGVWKKVLTNIL